eukprot:XP_014768151.1 PREDICTED: cilia- and flagella-associated protein 99-like [Octopus bimaculoides]
MAVVFIAGAEIVVLLVFIGIGILQLCSVVYKMAMQRLNRLGERFGFGTVVKPFNLTKPAFRKVPIPQPIPKLGKAKPVPKTLYEEPSEFKTLYSIKKNNKVLAEEHLKELANLELKCADPTLKEKTYLKLREIENERNKLLQFNKKKCISMPNFETPTPIKMTKAAVLREGKVHLNEEEAELKWLEELEKGGKEDRQFVKWQSTMKEQDMKQSMLELEKLRLKSKIIREDAILAKEKLQEENRRTVLQLKQETEEMLQDYLQQQLEEEQQSKKVVQEIAEGQKMAKDAKKKVHEQKKKIVQDVQRGKQELNAAALENATIEMQKRLEIIDRIRVLTATQQCHNTKLFDTTETSGSGLLGEMSLAELQERLAVMRRWEQEDQEKKRYEILLSKQASQELISDTLDVILKHRNEKSQMTSLRRQKQKEAIKEDSHSKIYDDEINVLQRLLEEKRSRRLKCMQPSSKQISRKISPHKQGLGSSHYQRRKETFLSLLVSKVMDTPAGKHLEDHNLHPKR